MNKTEHVYDLTCIEEYCVIIKNRVANMGILKTKTIEYYKMIQHLPPTIRHIKVTLIECGKDVKCTNFGKKT